MTQIGKYVVVRELGHGGMGVVFEAHDPTLDRPVAVKLVNERGDPERFLFEARAAARVIHPNCVPIFDMGEHDGKPFLVMELVVGMSADDYLKRRGPLQPKIATQIVASACRGLSAVHDAGLVHRDIKPSNLLLSKSGGVKVADFGLARAMGASTPSLTGSRVVGTPHYMSPEQCYAEPVDARSDIYALGATYFVLLTNRPPFRGEHELQIMFAHCNDPIPDPRSVIPEVPEACAKVVRKALAKSPAERYQTAREMLTALDAVLAAETNTIGESIADTQKHEPNHPTPTEESSPKSNAALSNEISKAMSSGSSVVRLQGERKELPERDPLKPSRRAWLLALPAVAAAGVGGYFAFRGKSEENRPEGQGKPVEVAKTPVLVPARNVGGTVGICGIAVSDDARWLAVGMDEASGPAKTGGVKLFDRTLGTTEPVWWKWGDEPCPGVAFSPDGKLLAVGCGGQAKFRVWSFAEQKELIFQDAGVGSATAANRDLRGNVESVAFSWDSKYVAAGVHRWRDGMTPRPGMVRVWEVATKAFVRDLECQTVQPVRGISFAPTGYALAVAVKMGEGIPQALAEVWDAVSGARLRTIKLTSATYGPCVAFARKEPILAITHNETLEFRRASEFVEQPMMKTNADAGGVAITAKGDLVAIGLDSKIELAETATRTWVKQLTGHTGNIYGLAFTLDGTTLISGATDRTVREWAIPPRE